MKNRVLQFILPVILTMIITGCDNQHYQYHKFNQVDSAILKNHIKQAVITRIAYDSTGIAIWKRIEKINEYDDFGRIIKTTRPHYETSFSSPASASSDPFAGFMTETPDYRGFSSYSSYEYDTNNNWIKTIDVQFSSAYDSSILIYTGEYDKYNNLIKWCQQPPTAPITCLYYKFTYASDGKILSVVDSMDYDVSTRSRSIKFDYAYEGKVLKNDGKFDYTTDKQGRVLESRPLTDWATTGNKFNYDENGRVIEESEIHRNFANGEFQSSPIKSFYKYNARGLVIEKKVTSMGKLSHILRYEYQ